MKNIPSMIYSSIADLIIMVVIKPIVWNVIPVNYTEPVPKM